MGLPPFFFSFHLFISLLLFYLLLFEFLRSLLFPLFSSYLNSHVHFFSISFFLFYSSISFLFEFLRSLLLHFISSFIFLLLSILYIDHLPPPFFVFLSFMRRPTNVLSDHYSPLPVLRKPLGAHLWHSIKCILQLSSCPYLGQLLQVFLDAM